MKIKPIRTKADEYERAYRAFLAERPLKMKGRTLTREEANDRAGLRRRQRLSLRAQ